MNRKWRLALGVILVVAIGGYMAYGQYSAKTAARPLPVLVAETRRVVTATGDVVPREWARLSFKAPGRVKTILVKDGDPVQAGQDLALLESAELEQSVALARAELDVAKAGLAKARAGARPQEVSGAAGNLSAAQGQLSAAAGALQTAEAELARVKAGPRQGQVDSAKADVERAQAALKLAQAEYDKISWMGERETMPQALALQQTTIEYERGKALYQNVLAGATSQEIAVAEGNVSSARAGVETAGARVAQAQSAYDLVRAGAAIEDIAVAEATVRQVEAAVAAAQLAVDNTRLKSPIAGSVANTDMRVGEVVTPANLAAFVGDLKNLRVETTDLNEVDVARIKLGQKAEVTFDAIREKKVAGTVTNVALKSTSGQGGTNYTVTIQLAEQPAELRWGMTAFVDILTD